MRLDGNAAQGLNLRLNRRIVVLASGLFALALCFTLPARAQSTTPPQGGSDSASSSTEGPVAHGTIATAAPVTYDNRYEIFGGLSYMNFTAGPFAIPRMNMGGGEVMGTYWLRGTHRFVEPGRLGLAADFRTEWGTTQTGPNSVNLHRTLVIQNMVMGGFQVRGPKNQFFALSAHGLGGISWGNFSHGTLPAAPPEAVGLYTNRSAGIGAIGVSLDINQSKRFAIRLSPDLMLSKFGTATDTNFAIAGGIIYRFGK